MSTKTKTNGQPNGKSAQPKNAEERKETLPLTHVEMANNANRMGYLSTDDPDLYKTTQCPCGHEAFLRVAVPLTLTVGGVQTQAIPRQFSEYRPEAERSFGWGANGQVAWKLNAGTKADWESTQDPIKVSINGVEKMMLPKAFGTGSVGWYLGDKVATTAGDWAMMVQVGLQIIVNKSKDMADDHAFKAGWVNCTMNANLTVVNSRGR